MPSRASGLQGMRPQETLLHTCDIDSAIHTHGEIVASVVRALQSPAQFSRLDGECQEFARMHSVGEGRDHVNGFSID